MRYQGQQVGVHTFVSHMSVMHARQCVRMLRQVGEAMHRLPRFPYFFLWLSHLEIGAYLHGRAERNCEEELKFLAGYGRRSTGRTSGASCLLELKVPPPSPVAASHWG